MALSKAALAHLAELARIQLSDAELDLIAPQLDVILDAVATVSQFANQDIPPTSHAVALRNVMRPDEVAAGGFDFADVLEQAPVVADGMFRVPRILEETL